MPTMIEGLRERLVAELEKRVSGEGSELTLRTLARRAGVAGGTIYYYFPDKDDLFRALFQKEWEENKRFIRTLISDTLKGNADEQG